MLNQWTGNLIDEAAGLVTGPMYLVDEHGVPPDVRVMAMAELICQAYGLHVGFVREVAKWIITKSGARTFTRIDKSVLVCSFTGCDEMSGYWDNGMAVCGNHVGWEPDEMVCHCEGISERNKTNHGTHHDANCPWWLPSAAEVAAYTTGGAQ